MLLCRLTGALPVSQSPTPLDGPLPVMLVNLSRFVRFRTHAKRDHFRRTLCGGDGLTFGFLLSFAVSVF